MREAADQPGSICIIPGIKRPVCPGWEIIRLAEIPDTALSVPVVCFTCEKLPMSTVLSEDFVYLGGSINMSLYSI